MIRIAPPLMISREDLDWGLQQIESVLAAGSHGSSLKSEEAAFSQVA